MSDTNTSDSDVLPLKEWRLRRHMSHRQLAKAAQVSTETLLRAEKGGRVYELTARKIGDALGVAVAQVVEFNASTSSKE